MKNILAYFLLGVIALAMAGCQAQGSQGSLSVAEAWIRAPGNTDSMDHAMEMEPATPDPASELTTAAFLSISNKGAEADRLLRVESDLAQAVELHLSEMKDEVMTMRPVDGIDIPAGATVELQPGGYHIMLINLQQAVMPGEKYPLTLVFENAGPLTIEAEARAP
jgi:copper(I)-binding protein